MSLNFADPLNAPVLKGYSELHRVTIEINKSTHLAQCHAPGLSLTGGHHYYYMCRVLLHWLIGDQLTAYPYLYHVSYWCGEIIQMPKEWNMKTSHNRKSGLACESGNPHLRQPYLPVS